MLARLQSFFNPPHFPERAPRRIFWVALIVRIAFVLAARTYHIRALNDHFDFGSEMGRVARALATGRGYADAFDGFTGPTAWVPPLYPLLLGAVFRIFGVYTDASAFVILAINCAFSAATAPLAYAIARRVFRGNTDAGNIALWSAWLWALYPAAMQYAVKWVWDMSLTACLFAGTILLALRLRDTPGRRALWLGFGALWGLIALANSSLILVMPATALWSAWPTLRQSATLRNLALATLCCVAVISPWTIRNAYAFHAFVPLRSNFGAELYESAWLLNEGYPTMATLPHARSAPDFQRYLRLGELAYCRQQGERAWTTIHAHPGEFAAHIAKRAYFFWASVPHPTGETVAGLVNETGRELNYAFLSLSGLMGLALALRNREPGAWLLFWAFAIYPLTYYAITVQARFRHPLEPLICILGVYLFRSAEPRSRSYAPRR